MTAKERANFIYRVTLVVGGLGAVVFAVGRGASSDIFVYIVIAVITAYIALGVLFLAASRCPHCGRHVDLRGKGSYCLRCGKWIPLREGEPPSIP